MPGDLWQKFANMRLLYSYMWTPSRQEAAVHGGRVRPVERMELRHQPAMGPAAVGIAPGLAENGARHEPLVSPRAGAVRGRLRPRPASSGSTATTATRACWAMCAGPRIRTTFWSWPATSRRRRDCSHRLGVPELCWYEEIFNSDSTYYGGSNLGNGPGIMAEEVPSHCRPASIQIALPPLAVTVLKPRR